MSARWAVQQRLNTCLQESDYGDGAVRTLQIQGKRTGISRESEAMSRTQLQRLKRFADIQKFTGSPGSGHGFPVRGCQGTSNYRAKPYLPDLKIFQCSSVRPDRISLRFSCYSSRFGG